MRIKKHQQAKIEQWSKALDITESRFVEDAVTFYLRYLEGKQVATPLLGTVPDIKQETSNSTDIEVDNLDDFDGGIDL